MLLSGRSCLWAQWKGGPFCSEEDRSGISILDSSQTPHRAISAGAGDLASNRKSCLSGKSFYFFRCISQGNAHPKFPSVVVENLEHLPIFCAILCHFWIVFSDYPMWTLHIYVCVYYVIFIWIISRGLFAHISILSYIYIISTCFILGLFISFYFISFLVYESYYYSFKVFSGFNLI